MRVRTLVVLGLSFAISGCASTMTEYYRGCERWARWAVGTQSLATWLRDTDKIDANHLLALAKVDGKANNLNLCWYTSTGDQYGVLRARRADWQADYEMLFEFDGEWQYVDTGERPWPPVP